MSSVRNVLIVGGGIAGMSLAVALRDSDIRTEIVELTPEWTALGIGIALTAPSCRALKTLGVLEQCIDAGFSVTKVGQIAADSFEVSYVGEAPRLLGPAYPASLGIMRPVFHQILADASRAAGAVIRLGLTVQAIDQSRSSEKVVVTFTDGTEGAYDLVVGADGIGSRVRELVWGPELEPRFTGQSVWRITVPRPHEVEAIVSVQGGPNANVGFNPVSRDLMYIFIVQNTPEKVRLPEERLPELARAQLAGYGGLVARAREQIADAAQVLMRPIEAILVPPPWFRGRVLLIGDAAHATTPHMASGACIAIEDAVVLGELLRTDLPLAEVLTAFMERRYERCRMVVENSIQLGEWQKRPGAAGADPARLAHESQTLLAQPI